MLLALCEKENKLSSLIDIQDNCSISDEESTNVNNNDITRNSNSNNEEVNKVGTNNFGIFVPRIRSHMLIGDSAAPNIIDDSNKEESIIRIADGHAIGSKFDGDLVISRDDDRSADDITGVEIILITREELQEASVNNDVGNDANYNISSSCSCITCLENSKKTIGRTHSDTTSSRKNIVAYQSISTGV